MERESVGGRFERFSKRLTLIFCSLGHVAYGVAFGVSHIARCIHHHCVGDCMHYAGVMYVCGSG